MRNRSASPLGRVLLGAAVGALIIASAVARSGAEYQIAPASEGNVLHLELYDPGGDALHFTLQAEVLECSEWIECLSATFPLGPLAEAALSFDVAADVAVGTRGGLTVLLEARDEAGRLVDSVERRLDFTVAADVAPVQRSYRIEECCLPVSDAGEELAHQPPGFVLLGNAPNPARPLTNIQFGLPAGGAAPTLRIFDLAGRAVRIITAPQLGVGYHKITWNGKDDAGRLVAPGIYYYELSAGSWSATREMLLLR